MSDQTPSCLLYLLTVGREHELVLRVSGPVPTEDELMSWMHDGAVRPLRVSPHRDAEAFTFMVNFGHVVGARIAPYSDSHSASF
jgi:hypothetical protein